MNLVNVFYKDNNAIEELSNSLKTIIKNDLVIVCIGSDKFIFDSLGPFIGTHLNKSKLNNIHIYGTLENTINARNIETELIKIKSNHPNSTILAIDASLGNINNIGKIKLSKGPLYPGIGMAYILPPIGDYSITAITANKHTDIVRLNLIVEISEIIYKSILEALD